MPYDTLVVELGISRRTVSRVFASFDILFVFLLWIYRKSWKQNATKVGNKTPQKLETNVNKEKQMPLRLPDLKIVITGTQ